jgi:hypothetical protein
MDTQTAIVLVVAILVVGALAWFVLSQRRSRDLQSKFGPEYERLVAERGGRRRAEAELKRRADRVQKLAIKPLPAEERHRYAQLWEHEQARFVDDPGAAVVGADRLVEEVMSKRGYPVGDFEEQAADISVDHPEVVEHYRIAHAITTQHERKRAGTEDLREAMIHFRALFAELLEDRRPREAHSR